MVAKGIGKASLYMNTDLVRRTGFSSIVERTTTMTILESHKLTLQQSVAETDQQMNRGSEVTSRLVIGRPCSWT